MLKYCFAPPVCLSHFCWQVLRAIIKAWENQISENRSISLIHPFVKYCEWQGHLSRRSVKLMKTSFAELWKSFGCQRILWLQNKQEILVKATTWKNTFLGNHFKNTFQGNHLKNTFQVNHFKNTFQGNHSTNTFQGNPLKTPLWCRFSWRLLESVGDLWKSLARSREVSGDRTGWGESQRPLRLLGAVSLSHWHSLKSKKIQKEI